MPLHRGSGESERTMEPREEPEEVPTDGEVDVERRTSRPKPRRSLSRVTEETHETEEDEEEDDAPTVSEVLEPRAGRSERAGSAGGMTESLGTRCSQFRRGARVRWQTLQRLLASRWAPGRRPAQ